MQKCRQILLGGALAMMFMTSGCDMTTPSQVSINKIRVRDKTFTQTLNADHVDKLQVASAAQDILHSGSSDAALLMPYAEGGESKAWRIGNAYKKAFEARGITHLTLNVVPMEKGQPVKEAVLSYEGLTALAPADCERMLGYQGGDTLQNADAYRYGCETEANLSKMVANPSDLLGTAPHAKGDSKRNGAIIDSYMTGKPNQQLKGMTASTIGAQ